MYALHKFLSIQQFSFLAPFEKKDVADQYLDCVNRKFLCNVRITQIDKHYLRYYVFLFMITSHWYIFNLLKEIEWNNKNAIFWDCIGMEQTFL